MSCQLVYHRLPDTDLFGRSQDLSETAGPTLYSLARVTQCLITRRRLVYRPDLQLQLQLSSRTRRAWVAGPAIRLLTAPPLGCLSFAVTKLLVFPLCRSLFGRLVQSDPRLVAPLVLMRGRVDTTRPVLPASLGVSVIRQLQSCASLLSQHPVSCCPSHALSFVQAIPLRYVSSPRSATELW